MARPARRLPAALAAAAALTALAAAAQANDPVTWPADRAGADAAAADPIAPARWASTGQWSLPQSSALEAVLGELDGRRRARLAPAVWQAYRAVVLRMLGRYDEAAAALARADELAAQPGAAPVRDPDVTLTRAYLLARAQRYADAVTAARRVLPQLGGTREARGELVLEVARWSMARGPEGLPEAVALTRELVALEPPAPMVRAALALALARQGQGDEAREVARGGALPSAHSVMAQHRRGALLPGEVDAAVGVALVLTGRGREAVDVLTRASTTVPPPWRAQVAEALAAARRAAAAATQPGVPQLPLLQPRY